MAQVNITIHGKTYGIACDDGQERRVQELGRYVDLRLKDIAGAGAATNESHLLVLTALVLADEVFDAQNNLEHHLQAAPEPVYEERMNEEDERIIVDAINQLAARIDSVADRLLKI